MSINKQKKAETVKLSNPLIREKLMDVVADAIYLNGPLESSDIKEALKENGFDINRQQLNGLLERCRNYNLVSTTWGDVFRMYTSVRHPYGKSPHEKIWQIKDPEQRKLQAMTLYNFVSTYEKVNCEIKNGEFDWT